jgi:hypothetical protein
MLNSIPPPCARTWIEDVMAKNNVIIKHNTIDLTNDITRPLPDLNDSSRKGNYKRSGIFFYEKSSVDPFCSVN